MALDARLGPCQECGGQVRRIKRINGQRVVRHVLWKDDKTHPARPVHTGPVTTGSKR